MNARIYPNMITFVPVRRGNWVIKLSVYKSKYVLLVAQHMFHVDQIHIQHFSHHNEASDWIECNLLEDNRQ